MLGSGWILLYCPGLSSVLYFMWTQLLSFITVLCNGIAAPDGENAPMGKKELQKFSESRNSTVLWIDYLRDVDHDNGDYNIKYHYHNNNDDNIISHYHGNDENHYLGAAEKEEKAALAKKALQAPTAQLG